ncbi:Gfo/Idh/MocA family protein [Paenibacillus sp. DMB20]|uniref:Gfo/Idh/MocA family protein n=1 Tax=Paenibacillus sp. DMB20 TaxID=1642570 RepID=UPI000AF5544F|nr:Gfo/Idh/MocA family oxidoreductase [Paenibacillus sp. DMB20]
MSRKLKLGVVGTGNIFRSAHLPAWLEHPEIEVVALCDVVQERAQKLADEHGIALVYTNYRELLRHGDIDAVDICTPNHYHSEVAVAALKAGIHVFCEKPDAVNPEKAEEMADAAAASGKVLMTMRNNRFTPASQYLKRYINEGHMGEIYTGRCGWLRRRGIPARAAGSRPRSCPAAVR